MSTITATLEATGPEEREGDGQRVVAPATRVAAARVGCHADREQEDRASEHADSGQYPGKRPEGARTRLLADESVPGHN